MEMHQIRYFLALCEEKSFTRAAKRCGVSQPSLTNAIKRLEAEFGGPLFERSRRMTRLSSLGEIVRPNLAEMERSAANANRTAAAFLIAPSVTHQPRAMEVFMRSHHVIAIAAVLVVGFGTKQFFFPPVKAVADLAQASQTMDLRALMETIDVKSLPRQEILSEADE
jgi:molybdenum-dependent DNA-binding transcriptional regulator ModE